MKARELINQITTDDIIKIMGSLGVDVVRETNDFLIFSSVCHGSDSHKLYLYKSSKTFYCYSHCGNMSLFDLIMSIKQCEFKDAFKYVKTFATGGGIHGFYKPYRKKSLEDIIVEPLPVINKPYLYKIFKNCEIKEWLEDNINYNATSKFNIRKDLEGNRIIIPHFNIKGECVGIRCRHLNPKDVERKGKYTPIWYDNMSYAHQLSLNLYGIHISKENIKKYKKVIVVESEKGVLQYESYYPGNNICVAICGSTFSQTHKKTLLELGAKEIVIALDRQYEYEDTEDATIWKNKILKMSQDLLPYCKVSYIWDTDENRLLEYKDSPLDRGKKVFQKLIGERIYIN